MFVWGIFAGAIGLFASIGAIGRRKPTWMYRWFRPWGQQLALGGNTGEKGFMWRVKLALSPYNHVYALPLFAPLAIMGMVWLFWPNLVVSLPTQFLPGMMLGYAGAAVLAYPIDLTKSISSYRQQIAIFAAQKLARRMPPALANEILVPLTHVPQASLRIAAAMGLRELGTKEGGEALKALTEDKHDDVAVAARNAYGDLETVYRGVGLLSVRTMETYASEHAYLVKRVRAKRGKAERSQDVEKLEEITRQIDEIVFSQLPLRRSFPDIFCMDCFARGESQRYEEWDWVRCRQCKEVHALRPGVTQVIGQIGGESGWNLEHGVLRLSLWDDAVRKGRAADLNVLEVIGGQPINYDWAVSAVVDKMHNLSQGIENRVAVKLVNAPVLEGNSLQLLKTLDQSMIVN
jgi:hypothetical protein